MTREQKHKIDNMSHEEMVRFWRFGPVGNELFVGKAGQYFSDRLFVHFGGITPELSKKVGWGNG